MLVLLGVLLFLLLLITVFAVVKDLAYRRIRVRRDVYQIEICFFSERKSFVNTHDAAHHSFFVDETYNISPDFIIDLGLILFIIPGANGSVPPFPNRAPESFFSVRNKNCGRTSIRK
jgi:hypothetical protein